MQPTFLTLPAFSLVGLEAPFFGPMSETPNNHVVIPALFDAFFARRMDLPPALDRYVYGANQCAPASRRTRPDELLYLVGLKLPETLPVPAGMVRWSVPAMTYAHFVHHGPVRKIGETVGYIFGTWLPNSGYDYGDGPCVERYDDRFRETGKASELDILIPVTPRQGR